MPLYGRLQQKRCPVARSNARTTSGGKPSGYVGSGAGTTPMSSQWPVVESLPGPERRRRPCTTGAARRRDAAHRQDAAQAETLEHRQRQPADRVGDVRQRVGARVAVVGGIRAARRRRRRRRRRRTPAAVHDCWFRSRFSERATCGRTPSASTLREAARRREGVDDDLGAVGVDVQRAHRARAAGPGSCRIPMTRPPPAGLDERSATRRAVNVGSRFWTCRMSASRARR